MMYFQHKSLFPTECITITNAKTCIREGVYGIYYYKHIELYPLYIENYQPLYICLLDRVLDTESKDVHVSSFAL